MAGDLQEARSSSLIVEQIYHGDIYCMSFVQPSSCAALLGSFGGGVGG